MKFAAAVVAWAAFTVAAFAQDPTPPPPAPEGMSGEQLLPALVAHSRHVASVENGRLEGEGADFLRRLAANAQFVMLGEDHGDGAIAQFSAALWGELNDIGYNHLAIETDPWAAEALERELRAGGVAGWTEFAAAHGGAVSVPFYTWSEEARLLDRVVGSASVREGPVLWGLDQAFIGSASWQLRHIADEARNPQARALAGQLSEASDGSLQWLGQSDAAPLLELRALLNGRRDAELARLVDAMVVSQRIYRPFTGGEGEALLANTERENLMRRNFLDYYNAAARQSNEPPRAMFKFGEYHMYRGASPTYVQALGTFVTEFAAAHGRTSLSITAVCGPGGSVGTLDRQRVACDEYFSENWAFLAPVTAAEGLTIFDLREWRLRPGRWEHLSHDMRRLISSYDIVVVVPGGAPAEFLPGLAMPVTPPS